MSSPEAAGVVEIEFAAGGRMRISGSVDASTVSALVKALVRASGDDNSGPERHPGLAGGRPHRHDVMDAPRAQAQAQAQAQAV